MTRTRTPRTAGDQRRRENMKHLEFMVQLAMPEGITTEELIPRYAYDVGITEKKAIEHLNLLEKLNIVHQDDLRWFFDRTRDQLNLEQEADRLSRR